MNPEELTQRVARLDTAAARFTGSRKLHKSVQLIELKAHLAGCGLADLRSRLQRLPQGTLDRLDLDIGRAVGDAASDGEQAAAFDRAVGFLESLAADRH